MSKINEINISGMSWKRAKYRAKILIKCFSEEEWFRELNDDPHLIFGHKHKMLYYQVINARNCRSSKYKESVYRLANSYSIMSPLS